MPTMTKKTTAVWSFPNPTNEPERLSEHLKRQDYIQTAVTAGKTDGILVTLGLNGFDRVWVDETAATEWMDFSTQSAQRCGATVSFTLSDI